MKIIKEVNTVDEWFSKYPPKKGEEQWKDGYSAKETAKEYTDNDGKSLMMFLEKNNIEEDFILVGEHETKFDKYGGNGRYHDVLLYNDETVIGIECKVNETYSNYVSMEIEVAATALRKKIHSKKLNRITDLLDILDVKKKPDITKIRYQLLTALAGVIKEAEKRNAKKAYLICQTFITEVSDDKCVKLNESDLDYFISMLPGEIEFNGVGLTNKIELANKNYPTKAVELYIGVLKTIV